MAAPLSLNLGQSGMRLASNMRTASNFSPTSYDRRNLTHKSSSCSVHTLLVEMENVFSKLKDMISGYQGFSEYFPPTGLSPPVLEKSVVPLFTTVDGVEQDCNKTATRVVEKSHN